MFYDSDVHGCGWRLLNAGLLIYYILCLIADGKEKWVWLIIAQEIIYAVLIIVDRKISEKRRYYRKDSFWLRKDDPEDKESKKAEDTTQKAQDDPQKK